ncbi:TetR/AcrR family transcriptional regulator [Actinokineospora soli]
MGRKPGPGRERMLASAITLLREQGVSGTSIDAVLAHSGTSRGSVYHYFPGGRTELLLDAARAAAAEIEAMIGDADPRSALIAFTEEWKRALVDSGFRGGCPIVALTVDEVPGSPELVREIFAAWQTKVAAVLTAAGAPPARTRSLATLAVAAIEGAVVLCRATASTERVGDVLAELLALLDGVSEP